MLFKLSDHFLNPKSTFKIPHSKIIHVHVIKVYHSVAIENGKRYCQHNTECECMKSTLRVNIFSQANQNKNKKFQSTRRKNIHRLESKTPITFTTSFSYSDQGDTVFSMIVIFSATLPTPVH
ncbi:hypothetical protein CDAR_286791 [Caerostris darwini]|uniref:Uncharacterized protein n=1 Tax=Caerostris darwini TaxID=1538125 RepID=A0AAV4R9C0_9ARAC|nr:hypothetical protein CDAR_286791 [Caerostris darwini]